jgi:hypothetical protein
MEILNNGFIKVGVDLSLGGAITLLSLSEGSNLINQNPPASDRLVQDYWGDPLGGDMWPWNPTQAFSQVGSLPSIVDSSNDGVTIYTKSNPVLFEDMNGGNDAVDMYMEQWTSLHGSTVKVRCKATHYGGADRSQNYNGWPGESAENWYNDVGWNQPLGTCFLTEGFGNAAMYTGGTPWDPASTFGLVANTQPNGRNWEPAEKWAALMNGADFGVGIHVPSLILNGTPSAVVAVSVTDFGYLACNKAFGWTPGATLEYTAYYTIGSLNEIRTRFHNINDGLTPALPLIIDDITTTASIESVTLVLTHGEFTIGECSSASSVGTVEIVQSYGILAIADCAAASAIATPGITLNSNGTGIRSPSGSSYTPRSLTGEQLTIRRFSNGAWI